MVSIPGLGSFGSHYEINLFMQIGIVNKLSALKVKHYRFW